MTVPAPRPSLTGLRWTVAGAGVLGVSIAWRLARAGASVILCDPAPVADNASGIAAGMLAPAFEAALDPDVGFGLEALLAARDLWPTFASEAGIALDRSGALMVGADAPRAADRFIAIGAPHGWLSAGEAAALSPGLEAAAPALFTPEDWRLDAPEALRRLISIAQAAGVQVRRAAVTRHAVESRRVWLSDGETLSTDGLVLATGAATGLGAESSLMAPFKGQIVRSVAGPATGPTVRGSGVYIVPGRSGAIVGATMEPVNDRRIDPGTVRRLLDAGSRLFPALSTASYTAAAAVRAASPDGLPLVGWSKDGALLAIGARRNGWLLAPWIADRVVRLVEGDPDAAPALDPLRFFSHQPTGAEC